MNSTSRNNFKLTSYLKVVLRQLNEFPTYASDDMVKLFGVFGLINYPIFYFVWQYMTDSAYEDIVMRLIATVFCMVLVLKDYWPPLLNRWTPIIWYVIVLYCLPFFGTFMFLKNHASPAWMINILLGLFWLIMILDWRSFSVILPLGTIMGIGYYFVIIGPPSINNENLTLTFINVIWVIITSIVFARKKEITILERINTLKALGATIAHEMRTPFSTIAVLAKGIETHLPSLIESYTLAKKAALPVPDIDIHAQNSLSNTAITIEKACHNGITVIEMLLLKLEMTKTDKQFTIHSMKNCILKALEQYPFNRVEKSKVHFNALEDFYFKGNELLILHVIFNLLKNALYYLQPIKKGQITITLARGKGYNKVIFKDTGPGIAKRDLPFIFKKFFSKSKYGTGLGLAFCKTVLNSHEGEIYCRSEEGKYTEFELQLPVIETFL